MHDTHIHLDLYKNYSSIINEIESKKMYTISVTNHPKIYKILKEKIKSRYVRVGLGFHPELIQKYKSDVELFINILPNIKYVGEIGLDFSGRNKESSMMQREFLKRVIIVCRNHPGKIISIHSRNAERDVLDIIGEDYTNAYIMHWYSGGYRVHTDMIKKGYYFSFNYQMLSSKKGAEILLRTPLNKILLESDGPFTKIDNKTYIPSKMFRTIFLMSSILGISITELENILKTNFNDMIRNFN